MLESLDKYIYDVIGKYICAKYFRLISKKFKNFGLCKMIFLTVINYKYSGCSVHSNFSYKTINTIINTKTNNYKFDTYREAAYGKQVLFNHATSINYKLTDDKCGFCSDNDFKISKVKGKYKAQKINDLQ